MSGKRVDGRGMDEMRPLAAEVGLLPRVHGSGMFTRGQTQVLTHLLHWVHAGRRAGCWTASMKRPKSAISTTTTSPPTRWARPARPAARAAARSATARSAERALRAGHPAGERVPLCPAPGIRGAFPPTAPPPRASICGSTLALMDAGVPIKAPVAGISCGLISEGGGQETTIADIQGLEDFYGDMDFKVARYPQGHHGHPGGYEGAWHQL